MQRTWSVAILGLCACVIGGGEEDAGSTGATGGASQDAPTSATGATSTGEPPTSDGPTSAGTTSAGTTSADTTGAGTTGDDTTGDDTTGAPPAKVELLVCNFFGDSVTRFDPSTGALLGTLAATDELDGALGITVGPDGDIYVASEESNAVLRYAGASGEYLGRFVWDDPGTPEDETGGLEGPGAVLFGADGMLYVSSFDSDAVLRYDGATGAFVDVFVAEGAGGLDGPDAGMTFGPDGDLFVPGFYSNTVSRFAAATGEPLPDFTPTDLLDNPRTLIFADGYLYVANEGSNEVLRYDGATGAFVDVFVAAGAGGLAGPAGMVFGPDGVLHVASVGNDRVLRFDADGQPLPELIDGPGSGIAGPTHITLAPAQ